LTHYPTSEGSNQAADVTSRVTRIFEEKNARFFKKVALTVASQKMPKYPHPFEVSKHLKDTVFWNSLFK
jgi:hypothetical protein